MSTPDLQVRLVNWAIYVRGYPVQDISPTGEFCDDLARRAGQGVVGGESKPKREIDDADAWLVELAWRKCMPRNKDLLRWLYVWNAKPEVVCRWLKISPKPRSRFDIARYHAETEIFRFLEEPDRMPQSLIPQLPR